MKETELREVKVVYSTEELDAIREDFSLKQIDLEELKEEKASVSKGYSDRIKAAEKIQKGIRTVIKDGFEFKSVECEIVPNYATKMVEYYSTSTGEKVDERRMTPAERQMRLDNVQQIGQSQASA